MSVRTSSPGTFIRRPRMRRNSSAYTDSLRLWYRFRCGLGLLSLTVDVNPYGRGERILKFDET
jgi:hypothetical protein